MTAYFNWQKLLITLFLLPVFAACSDSTKQGKDAYYEYSSTEKIDSLVFTGTMKIYLSSKGKIKTVIDKQDPFCSWISSGNGKLKINIEHVYHVMQSEITDLHNTSLQYFLLDDSLKTYEIAEYEQETNTRGLSEITTLYIIGDEIVNGFRTTHIRFVTTEEYNNKRKIRDIWNLWFSKHVPVPNPYHKKFSSILGMEGIVNDYPVIKKLLAQKKYTGLIVKATFSEKRFIELNLNKAIHTSIPDSLFTIPSAYKLNEKKYY